MALRSIYPVVLLLFLSFHIGYSQGAIYNSDVIHHPIVGKNGMVSSQHPLASEAGLEILKKGGNAVDAAVAVGFTLAVVLPRAGNLGGGGFMIVYDSDTEATHALNYREMAPASAHRNMYLDDNGDVDRKRITISYQASGVPGTVAGLAKALEKYGTMSLSEVLQPAIRLAEDGFPMTYDLVRLLHNYESRLRRWPESEKIFFPDATSFYKAGDLLVQRDLAWSLRQIAENGIKAFYGGEIGKRIARDMQSNGGEITLEDLRNYKVEETQPVWGNYRGYQVASMPPPSSGGVHVLQMLNMLEEFPLKYFGHNSAEAIHIMAEVMKLAYADRSEHLGDPNFWDVPVEGLIDPEYAHELVDGINRFAATPSEEIKAGTPQDYESEETTQFTVVDSAGNVVSNTYTLNFSFGSGVVAKGTGILMNNEMDDFSAKPGTPNAFGMLGGDANAIQPMKRPLSSMTPTMVFKDGKPYFATGSPGGSRIITTVLQIILNIIDYDMNVAEASHAPRIHHQWYPEILYIEKGISSDTQALLYAKRHNVRYRSAMGSTQTIMLKDGLIYGASDPRRPDAATRAF